ncbi:MAG: hypothetical protein HQL40_12345 [Alphaproteobacteria bacterium]|nr:hypothetical protein [Alphaproteobacteria bacterium]
MTDQQLSRRVEVFGDMGLALAVSVALAFSAMAGLVTFHTLAELFTVVVAFAIYGVAWHARRVASDDYLLFVGIGYLAVAVFDTVHAVAIEGAIEDPTNLATQLWVTARTIEAGFLLGGLFVMGRRPDVATVNLLVLLATALVLSLLVAGWFPDMWTPQGGATLVQRVGEGVIACALLLAAALTWAWRARFAKTTLALMIAALLLKAASEAVFSVHGIVDNAINGIGHVLKVASYYLIYRAMMLACLERPYETMFRELAEAHDRLEAMVAQRTAQLTGLVSELERSNEELEHFAYTASHDLQEPLRMVTSYTQLLRRRYEGRFDAEADEFIGFVVEGSTRMQRMIHDLLAYSRVNREGRPFTAFQASEALEAATYNLAGAIEDSHGKIEAPEPLPELLGDNGQIERLLQNLIGNALKYRRPDVPPRITVAAWDEGDHWHFQVADNGIGIESRYWDRIFMIFQRLHTRREYQGTGVGLALCKRIVERHGGRIWVESAPSEGSTFHFTLAKRPPEPIRLTEPAPA